MRARPYSSERMPYVEAPLSTAVGGACRDWAWITGYWEVDRQRRLVDRIASGRPTIQELTGRNAARGSTPLERSDHIIARHPYGTAGQSSNNHASKPHPSTYCVVL